MSGIVEIFFLRIAIRLSRLINKSAENVLKALGLPNTCWATCVRLMSAEPRVVRSQLHMTIIRFKFAASPSYVILPIFTVSANYGKSAFLLYL